MTWREAMEYLLIKFAHYTKLGGPADKTLKATGCNPEGEAGGMGEQKHDKM